jgi:hypothetical protein
MASNQLACAYCGRKNFSSQKGLSQHQLQSKKCNAQLLAEFNIRPNVAIRAHKFLAISDVLAPTTQQLQSLLAKNPLHQYLGSLQKKQVLSATNPNKRTYADMQANEEQTEPDDANEFGVFGADSDQEQNLVDVSQNTPDDETVSPNSSDNSVSYTPDLRKIYSEYLVRKQNLLEFTKPEVNAIKLLRTLRQTRSPLYAYESVMKWHFDVTGAIHSNQKVTQCSEFVSRDILYQKLRNRYNIGNDSMQLTEISLPHSKSKAKVYWKDAKTEMISLLTDPRINDDDYLFFGNDPLSAPPDNLNYVEDLNTGRAYQKTYLKLIDKPGKQVLLPVIFYIDAANTGQFADLPITAVKFSLGIFTRKAREKDYMWRTLGYVPSVSKHKSKGRRIMLDSLHNDSVMAHPNALQDEGLADDLRVNKAQDYHCLLKIILESYVNLQETGFIWDLCYRNRVYRDIEFVLFTPFLKVDGDEGDKICGKYTSRGKDVACLCRYCECPTDKSDDPKADYPLKTKKKIERLVRNKRLDKLQKLSQHNIENASYKLRFGLHNKQGVHGACALEMLHALLLGMIKYVRDCFFKLVGDNSKLSDQINGLAKQFGDLLSRQSDRDFPVTRFAGGIKRGKLMAQEYPGILLCMAAVLRSTAGRELLATKKKEFGKKEALRDWSQLVETLLQWERWLRSPVMEKKHVKKARDKHRYIMYLMKKVAKRTEGMGLKLQKYHQIIHMADDILNFGVPLEVDTGSNESGHKSTKVAAKLTQKNEETFDKQTAIRLEETHLLEMAYLEMNGYYIENYLEGYPEYKEPSPELLEDKVGGAEYTIKWDEEQQKFLAIRKKKRR